MNIVSRFSVQSGHFVFQNNEQISAQSESTDAKEIAQDLSSTAVGLTSLELNNALETNTSELFNDLLGRAKVLNGYSFQSKNGDKINIIVPYSKRDNQIIVRTNGDRQVIACLRKKKMVFETQSLEPLTNSRISPSAFFGRANVFETDNVNVGVRAGGYNVQTEQSKRWQNIPSTDRNFFGPKRYTKRRLDDPQSAQLLWNEIGRYIVQAELSRKIR